MGQMPKAKKASSSRSQKDSGDHQAPQDDVQRENLLEVVSRSQRGFRDLIDSFDRLAFNLGLDGRVQVANRQFAEMTGLPFSAIIGHPIEEFIAEPTREKLALVLPRFLGNRFWTGVVPVRWKQRSEISFYDCTLYAVVKDGEVTGVSGLARDISTQCEAESRFADLFETLHEGVYFATPRGRLLDANPAAVRMLGYESKDDLLKQPFERHFAHPAERIALLEDLRKTESVRDRELTLRRKDGSSISVLNSCVAIRDAAGDFVRFQGSLEDITERGQMERRLREEQEFVRRLVACFPDIIVVLDTSGRYTFVSPRVQEFLGYASADFVGASIQDRPHPEDRDSVLNFFRSLISGEISFGAVEYRTAHKNGGWRTVRANASPLTNAEGKIIGVVASARDVTESKHLEQQLIQSEKLAAIGQMVSGVAHELNNPLTAILGVSDLLFERSTDDASRRQLQLIIKQARKAAELVQGLLMFSRPSRHQSQRVQVADLITRAIELQKTELEARHIAVKVSVAAGLSQIDVDPQHMTQVFVNLLSNAEQAIASLSDHGRISIHVGVADGYQEIIIDDDGLGVRSDIRSKIFDPFFTTHRTSGGSGLGLTICLVIVKEHGGTIEAQSSPEGGARFRILLPLPKDAPLPARSADRPSRGNLKGKTILAVDDEMGIRELIQDGLAARGARVDAVETAKEAWNRVTTQPYDLVLCDSNLTGESGAALIERIMQAKGSQAQRFVLMTGELLDPGQISDWEKKGVRALQKPFQVSELAAILEELLAVAGQQPKSIEQ